jgi:hypothetical protein
MRVGSILTLVLLAGVTTGPRCSGVRYSSSKATRTEASYRELPMVAESNPPAIVPQKTVSTPAPEPAPAPPARDELFFSTVRPILATKCAPCHNPGGRMYARLPFDDPNVLSSHSTGALRRLKGDDRATFEKWLATVAPPAAER